MFASALLCVVKLFGKWNFCNPAFVSSSLESGVEKLVHNGFCLFFRNISARHYENVGIVVQTRHVGNFRHPAKGGSYIRVFVERNSHSLSRAANGNSRVNAAVVNGTAEFVGKVGIIARILIETSVVLAFISACGKILLYLLFQQETCVV